MMDANSGNGPACFHCAVNLHVSTYNIHKGFSQFNRRMMIRELRDHLQLLGADIIFLQEVQGRHSRHAARFEDWPEEPQYEFLADQVWPDFAYGRNAVYDHGHHGNAILSRYPIVRAENQDVSHHALERRGMLHCEIELPDRAQRLHCICVHLALHERGRRHQVGAIIERLNREVPEGAPIVVAGDFNDWRNRAGKRLEQDLGLEQACRDHRGKPVRTFPSSFPVLRLDRIYVRGFRVRHTHVHHGPMWRRLSDHAALSAHLQLE
jgi:endonuclease/exonuclease/phosphatase family metal-dependent hydrolase